MDIQTLGDSVLRQRAAAVDEVTPEIRTLCEQMVQAMVRADGVGLAAPQIGASKRVIVLDVDGEFHVLINPELVETSGDLEQSIEGCLSVPGVAASVARRTKATVRGTTLDGETVQVTGEGLLARAIQHEMDHLDGRLFLDHLSPVKRQSLLKAYKRGRTDSGE